MDYRIAPIAIRPSTLTSISEPMVVSHDENDYGNAVRALNAVRRELAALEAGTPPYRLRGLKREELSLTGSVALHELSFGNLGGFRRAGPNSGLGRPDWHEVPDASAAEIAADFGDARAWRREFVATARSLAGGPGWVLLTYARRQKRFWNADLMAGATWRDPDRVEEWIAELPPDRPVAVYCTYGFDVGCNVTTTLIECGVDARFLRGGLAAWHAAGGARAMRPARP